MTTGTPMESQGSSRIAASLANQVKKGADAGQIADTVVATWQVIDAALSPIIGHGGVAALYKRNLYLTGQAYPWLAVKHEDVQPAMDLGALKSALAQQGSAQAAAAGGVLLQTFRELLAGLVGPALTEQLLHSVSANFSPRVGMFHYD
jgi:hypothetical protein